MVSHPRNCDLVAHSYEKYGFLCIVYFKVVLYTAPNNSQGCTLGVVTTLQAEWQINNLMRQGKYFLPSLKYPDWFGAPHTLLFCELQRFSPEIKWLGCESDH
jgi:hypothetical protein